MLTFIMPNKYYEMYVHVYACNMSVLYAAIKEDERAAPSLLHIPLSISFLFILQSPLTCPPSAGGIFCLQLMENRSESH